MLQVYCKLVWGCETSRTQNDGATTIWNHAGDHADKQHVVPKASSQKWHVTFMFIFHWLKLKFKWIGKCNPTVCPEGEKEQAEYMRTALLTTTCVPTWGMPLFYGMFHSHYFMTIPRAVLLKLISVLLEQGFSKWIPWILLVANSDSVGLGWGQRSCMSDKLPLLQELKATVQASADALSTWEPGWTLTILWNQLSPLPSHPCI